MQQTGFAQKNLAVVVLMRMTDCNGIFNEFPQKELDKLSISEE